MFSQGPAIDKLPDGTRHLIWLPLAARGNQVSVTCYLETQWKKDDLQQAQVVERDYVRL